MTDFVGSTEGGPERRPRDRFRALIERLKPPRGGTEIGAALERVLSGDARRDVLLVTDGLSHALDVQGLAR